MEGSKPGLWIGAAIVVAVIVVALSMPGGRKPPEHAASTNAASQPSASVEPARAVPDATIAAQSKAAGADAPATTKATQPPPNPSLPPEDPPIVPSSEPPLPTNVTREVVVGAIDRVHFALRDFRSALGENPVGTNSEITAALLGNNLKQVRIEMPEGSRMNEKKELCDPWGTPYFFHQQNAQKMEIRSAGPDQTLWTKDDIQL